MKTIDCILSRYQEGHQTVLLFGRSLDDLHVNECGQIRPLRYTLIREAYARNEMVTLQFNLAFGAKFETSLLDCQAEASLRKTLKAEVHQLVEDVVESQQMRATPHERFFRLFYSITTALASKTPIPPMMVLVDFGEDLTPSEGGNEFILQVTESIRLLAVDFRKRRHPFFFVLTSEFPDRVDQRIRDVLYPMELSQPDLEEKQLFLEALTNGKNYQDAQLEPGLDQANVANLSAKTPNSSLEEVFRASARTQRPVTAVSLTERKRSDVVRMSEGTLSLLDVATVQGVRLGGKTIGKPRELLRLLARQLKQGNPNMPIAVLLAGATSTAKTDLAMFTAAEAGVPAYQLNSPKGSLVGQTEARVRIMFRTFKEMAPCLGFVDEITEAFPMERRNMNLDSGASDAVLGEMQTALGDRSLAGRGLLVATTNCPWKIGASMASRFLFIPVLSPPEEDYPEILAAICESLSGVPLPESWKPTVYQCAQLFFHKGATPRLIRNLINGKRGITGGELTTEVLLRAANSCNPASARDRASAEYADLSAVDVCSDLDLLPWHNAPDYTLPVYLRRLVRDDGSVDKEALQKRLDHLKPWVSV